MLRRLTVRGLLALMLVLTGAYAVATVRAADAGIELRERRSVVEPRPSVHVARRSIVAKAVPRFEVRVRTRLLEHSLFQRPPPFLSE